MREIKFRAWDKVIKIMWEPLSLDEILGGNWELEDKDKDNSLPQDDYLSFAHNDSVWMQYTGLKDKNGLIDIYEGDIIDVNGLRKGNVYENKQETTDLVIEGFGTKTWMSTYQKAMDRGCKDAE